MNTRILASNTLILMLLCAACGSRSDQQTVERIRSEVATILKKDPAQIDVAKPLVAQGADELDVVEIVLSVEDAFDIEIPDSAIGENVEEVTKTLLTLRLVRGHQRHPLR